MKDIFSHSYKLLSSFDKVKKVQGSFKNENCFFQREVLKRCDLQ